MFLCIYIYKCIHREREKEKEIKTERKANIKKEREEPDQETLDHY